MTAKRGDFPGHLTFSQRHGYEPFPEPMQLEQISPDLRREIWNLVYLLFLDNALDTYQGGAFEPDYAKTIAVVFGRFVGRPISQITVKYSEISRITERLTLEENFNRLLDFLEIMIDEHESSDLAEKIGSLFTKHAAAYWLDTSSTPCRFIPCSSQEQGLATQRALEFIRQAGMTGATAHLHQAARSMNEQRHADSIRESIHAVESVARIIDPASGKTLGPALKSLEEAGVLKHPALKDAFQKLYGYTNDEQGIRHALLDSNTADVGLEEAQFMFGACASFAAYLTQKHQRAGET